MKTSIDIYIKTPFNTFVKSNGLFDETEKTLSIIDSKDLNGNETVIDMSVIMETDINSIITDVQIHKGALPNKYKDYNENDIRLESLVIDGDNITCNYTINAGSYRRCCVGFVAKAMSKVGERRTYFVYPPTYRGGVCW